MLLRATLIALMLAGCATTPSPEYQAAYRDCSQMGLRAMQSGLSDAVGGAVIEGCMRDRGFPVR
jgi:hypothetical protein